MANDTDVTPNDIAHATLGLLAGAGAFAALIRYVPPHLDFLSVLFWAMVCSACSGIVWSGLVGASIWLHRAHTPEAPLKQWLRNMFTINKGLGTAGGISKEPQYLLDSVLFSVIVFGPLTLVALRIQERASLSVPRVAYAAFLVGAAVGSCWFYWRRSRERVMALGLGYKSREVRIAWIWSAKLAIPSFAMYEVAILVLNGGTSLPLSLRRLLTRMLITTVFLPMFVSALALILPGKDGDENIRGVIAGFLLVLMFLSGLLVTQPIDLWRWLDELAGHFTGLFA